MPRGSVLGTRASQAKAFSHGFRVRDRVTPASRSSATESVRFIRLRSEALSRPLPRSPRNSSEPDAAMVNFFIGRPIFATVIAVLMLLIGGICAFLLPIAQYPQIAPPQVQITTTS